MPGARTLFIGGQIRWNQGQIRILLNGESGETANDIRRRARAVQKRAQRRVRSERYRTGRLYHSIGVSTRYPSDPGPVASITADAPHALMVEFGRRRVVPRERRWLHWQGDFAPVFTKSAEAVRGIHFMRDALDEAKD